VSEILVHREGLVIVSLCQCQSPVYCSLKKLRVSVGTNELMDIYNNNMWSLPKIEVSVCAIQMVMMRCWGDLCAFLDDELSLSLEIEERNERRLLYGGGGR